VGLLEPPAGDDPDEPPGGRRLVRFTGCGEDEGLVVHVEEKFLGPDTVHGGVLLFRLEGCGRFRLWFEPARGETHFSSSQHSS